MRGNKSRGTKPELALRSAVHALGMRYRVGLRPLPQVRRTADIVFTRAKVAVFLDGCFWHGCPEHHRPAKRNSEFWDTKIKGNIARDANTDSLLQEAGWRVVRIWEHEDPAEAARQIAHIIRELINQRATRSLYLLTPLTTCPSRRSSLDIMLIQCPESLIHWNGLPLS